MHNEILDLVDENNIVIETMARSEVFSKKLKNFRVVCALLTNNLGQLYIPRRALHKADYPGYLACVGGCVESGETYEEALQRETQEEVMIDVGATSNKFLGFISPYEHPVNGYVAVYEILIADDQTVHPTQQDFCETLWLFPPQLIELENKGEKITPNLSAIIKLYYKNLI